MRKIPLLFACLLLFAGMAQAQIVRLTFTPTHAVVFDSTTRISRNVPLDKFETSASATGSSVRVTAGLISFSVPFAGLLNASNAAYGGSAQAAFGAALAAQIAATTGGGGSSGALTDAQLRAAALAVIPRADTLGLVTKTYKAFAPTTTSSGSLTCSPYRRITIANNGTASVTITITNPDATTAILVVGPGGVYELFAYRQSSYSFGMPTSFSWPAVAAGTLNILAER